MKILQIITVQVSQLSLASYLSSANASAVDCKLVVCRALLGVAICFCGVAVCFRVGRIGCRESCPRGGVHDWWRLHESSSGICAKAMRKYCTYCTISIWVINHMRHKPQTPNSCCTFWWAMHNSEFDVHLIYWWVTYKSYLLSATTYDYRILSRQHLHGVLVSYMLTSAHKWCGETKATHASQKKVTCTVLYCRIFYRDRREYL